MLATSGLDTLRRPPARSNLLQHTRGLHVERFPCSRDIEAFLQSAPETTSLCSCKNESQLENL